MARLGVETRDRYREYFATHGKEKPTEKKKKKKAFSLKQAGSHGGRHWEVGGGSRVP